MKILSNNKKLLILKILELNVVLEFRHCANRKTKLIRILLSHGSSQKREDSSDVRPKNPKVSPTTSRNTVTRQKTSQKKSKKNNNKII